MDNILFSTLAILVLVLKKTSGDCQVGFIVDNSYVLYIDGTERLTGNDHSKKTETVLATSTDVIAIAAHNNQGASGFLVTSSGDIYSSNNTGTPVTWRCIVRNEAAPYLVNDAWTQPGFDDSAWPKCYQIGGQTTNPWVDDIDSYQPLNPLAVWMWTDNPGYNSVNDFGKPYSDGDIDILVRGTFTLIAGCQITPDTTTTTKATTATTTVTTTTTTTVASPVTAAAAASTTSGLSTTTIVLLALLGAFILVLIIGIIIFCCCCRQGGAVAVSEKGPGIYNGRPVAHVPVTSKLGDMDQNFFVETDGITSNLVALPKDTVRIENGYYY